MCLNILTRTNVTVFTSFHFMHFICQADFVMFVVTGCSWEAMATFRKKVDNRIRVQIENGVAQHHRSMFVIVGDRGRDQVKHNGV